MQYLLLLVPIASSDGVRKACARTVTLIGGTTPVHCHPIQGGSFLPANDYLESFLMCGKVLIAAMIATFWIGHVSAAMRCGTKLINVGDQIANVLEDCGRPIVHESDGPAMRNNGVPRKGSSKQDVVVYGPSGGAYQYLLFVNDELIRVDMRRSAPSGT